MGHMAIAINNNGSYQASFNTMKTPPASSHYSLHLKDGSHFAGASLHTKQDGSLVLCSLYEFPKGRTQHKVEFTLSQVASLHLIVKEPSRWDGKLKLNTSSITHTSQIF